MASVITATTSSGLVSSADNSGVLQLASGTGNLVTIPSVTGTAMVSGNMPAFSAYLGSDQTLSSGTWTKLQINTEEFDTNSNYDPTTNYRFTPNVAGYYQFSAGVYAGSGNNTALEAALYKNGSGAKYAYCYSGTAASLDDWSVSIAALIYMNGTTDYVELYGFAVGNTRTINSGAANTWFSGILVRGA